MQNLWKGIWLCKQIMCSFGKIDQKTQKQGKYSKTCLYIDEMPGTGDLLCYNYNLLVPQVYNM